MAIRRFIKLLKTKITLLNSKHLLFYNTLEIHIWLKSHSEVSPLVAIDDTDLSLCSTQPWGLSNFVMTDKAQGLSKNKLSSVVISFLNNK